MPLAKAPAAAVDLDLVQAELLRAADKVASMTVDQKRAELKRLEAESEAEFEAALAEAEAASGEDGGSRSVDRRLHAPCLARGREGAPGGGRLDGPDDPRHQGRPQSPRTC